LFNLSDTPPHDGCLCNSQQAGTICSITGKNGHALRHGDWGADEIGSRAIFNAHPRLPLTRIPPKNALVASSHPRQ
jgi:hypothetical protein